MNYYAIVNGINSICALVISIIIFRHRGSKAVHMMYAFFYLLIFFWTFFYFLWGIQTDYSSSLFWLQMLEHPITYIHVAYFHFALLFSETLRKYKKILIGCYALSTFFFIVNTQNGYFDLSYIRAKPPFYFWPHATPLLSIFIAFEVLTVFFSFVILFRAIRTALEPMRTRLKLFLTFAMIGWAGGMFNWFNFYDSTPINPIGNPAVTFYLLATAYLIFKHDVLGLNLVFKKTFVYALLTLFITLIYALFIIVFEKMFQTFLGYKSLVISVLAALTIALAFNPVRLFLNKVVDQTFFGKNIQALSSENVMMRDELQKSDRLKAVATLAAGMAHEIKNPLTSIRTFAEYLPEKYDDPEFRAKFKNIVVSEVDRVNSIVKQLLEFSKPRELELHKESIVGILDETLALLNNNLLKQKIVIVRDYQSSPSLLVDKNQLKQAFLNILLNSMQATPGGGKITALVYESNKKISISISDTGPGIPKDALPHIFDPFYSTKESGTGLGLSIVHGIISKHGGKIKVESSSGTGTRFLITFGSR